MSSTHTLLPTVADLQIGQRLREADEERLRRLVRRRAGHRTARGSSHPRSWPRVPR